MPCTILAIIRWPMRCLEFSFRPIRADHQSWVRGNKNRVRVKASQVRPVTDGQTHQQITRPARVYIMVLLLCMGTDAHTDALLDKYRLRNLHWAKCIIIATMQWASCPRPLAGNLQIGYLCFGILSISSRCCYWECEEFLDDSWNVRQIMGVPRIVKTNLSSQSARAERKTRDFIRQLDPGGEKSIPGWTLIKIPRGPAPYLFPGFNNECCSSISFAACSTAAIKCAHCSAPGETPCCNIW